MELPLLPKSRQRWISHLHSKRHRDRERCFLAEGIRTLSELLASTYRARFAVCTEEIAREHRTIVEGFIKRGVPCYVTDGQTLARLAQTTSPQGMLAVVEYPEPEPSSIPEGSVVALDGINDPGNAGTIVRTALWFGYAAVVFGQESVDRYHPKFVRATMGALFHLQLIEAPIETIMQQVSASHRIIGTCTSNGIPLAAYTAPLQPHVLVIGSEAHGLSPSVRSLVHDCVTIEGQGSFDSLNAAVAAAIVMYHLASKA